MKVTFRRGVPGLRAERGERAGRVKTCLSQEEEARLQSPRWKESDAAEKVEGNRGGCGEEPMAERSRTKEGRAAGSHRTNSWP